MVAAAAATRAATCQCKLIKWSRPPCWCNADCLILPLRLQAIIHRNFCGSWGDDGKQLQKKFLIRIISRGCFARCPLPVARLCVTAISQGEARPIAQHTRGSAGYGPPASPRVVPVPLPHAPTHPSPRCPSAPSHLHSTHTVALRV